MSPAFEADGPVVSGSWSPSRRIGRNDSTSRTRRINDLQTEEVLGMHYVSSDDAALTSDDHLETEPWRLTDHSDVELNRDAAAIGLGIGPSYQEPGSPTTSRTQGTPRGSGASSTLGKPHATARKRSNFQRSSSINDPFGALGSTPISDPRPAAYKTSGKISSPSQPPATQRRRLVGSSPKKLTMVGSGMRGFRDVSDSEDEGIGSLLSNRKTSEARPTMAQQWHKVVENVFDKSETRIDVSDRQIEAIHPVVADLAKFVAIDPPRSFEETSSHSSLPGTLQSEAFRRASSSRLPFARAATGSFGLEPNANTPSRAQLGTVRGAGKSGIQLYLTNNRLSKLPSALFEVGNLRVLSLRNNRLASLPPAIGDLHNLRELNVAGNELRFLPAEIQKLTLEQFSYWPNKFEPLPSGAKLEGRSLLSITGAVLASEATVSQPIAEAESDEDQAMEDDFIADRQQDEPIGTILPGPTPGNALTSSSDATLMGPPALPSRLTEGPAGVFRPPGPDASSQLPRRVFERTRSDAQVDDLLSRGGGRMLARQSLPASSLSSVNEPAPATDEAEMTEGIEGSTESAAIRPTPTPLQTQIFRVLGPLEVAQSALPSLREMCIRRLLSPYDDLRSPSPEAPSSPVTTRSSTSATSPEQRSVRFVRIPSSSSAYQFQYTAGKRPETLLESYENGCLRDLESSSQMEASTISLLESARRSIEGRWGNSRNVAASSSSRTAVSSSEDSWCKGVTGIVVDDSAAAVGDGMDGDADASSSGSEGADVTLSPSLERKMKASAAGLAALQPSGATVSMLDVSTRLDTEGDDSTLNPHFNRCPNPCHAQTHAVSEAAGVGAGTTSSSNLASRSIPSSNPTSQQDNPSTSSSFLFDYPIPREKAVYAPLFERSIEQRLEWVSHIGGFKVTRQGSSSLVVGTVVKEDVGLIPILWRGCGRGCLGFLER